jgi:hypothetical protein
MLPPHGLGAEYVDLVALIERPTPRQRWKSRFVKPALSNTISTSTGLPSAPTSSPY